MTLHLDASLISPFRLTSRPLRSSSVVASSLAALLMAPPFLLAAPPREAPMQLQAQPVATQSQPSPDRSSAYYHYGLAHLYEEMAINAGRQDYATQAVEEYKLALDADFNSPLLQDGLADLYFKIGRNKDAVEAAEDQVKRDPNDVVAHSLLGKIYLRSLGDMQGEQAPSPSTRPLRA